MFKKIISILCIGLLLAPLAFAETRVNGGKVETFRTIRATKDLEIPNSDDPDVSETGEISQDTDGWLRVYDSSLQKGIPIDRPLNFSITDPENFVTHAGRSTQSAPVWYNNTGMTLTITEIRANADEDDYTFLLFKSNSATDVGAANDTQIDSVACSTDGTSCYYVVISSGFDSATIETGKYLIWEHSSGTAETLNVYIEGYLGADVN